MKMGKLTKLMRGLLTLRQAFVIRLQIDAGASARMKKRMNGVRLTSLRNGLILIRLMRPISSSLSIKTEIITTACMA